MSHLPVGDNLYKCLVSKDPESRSSGLRRELRQLIPRLTSQLQISCPAQRRDHGGRRPRAPHRPQQDLHPAGVVPPLQEARPGPHLAPAPGVSWGQHEDDLTVHRDHYGQGGGQLLPGGGPQQAGDTRSDQQPN